jgi:hypothetical protein
MTTIDFNNNGTQELKVPGFGLPVSFQPDKFFRHGVNDFRPPRMLVTELAILQFIDAVTDKPDWQNKVFDDVIISKWKTESQAGEDTLMTDNLFEWCIKELRDKSDQFKLKGFVHTLEGPSTVIKADNYIGKELQDGLKRKIQPLLDVPDNLKDYHPNSNKQVINQVHPSLYPLIYGKSHILKTGRVGVSNILDFYGKGEVVPKDVTLATNNGIWSSKFQWLPSEVKFEGDTGTDVKVTSYINNLHPLYHSKLYPIIEKVISASIPLWNEIVLENIDYKDTHAELRMSGVTEVKYDVEIPEWAKKWRGKITPEGREKVEQYLALPVSTSVEFLSFVTQGIGQFTTQRVSASFLGYCVHCLIDRLKSGLLCCELTYP